MPIDFTLTITTFQNRLWVFYNCKKKTDSTVIINYRSNKNILFSKSFKVRYLHFALIMLRLWKTKIFTTFRYTFAKISNTKII